MPQPRAVEVLELAVAERIDAIVDMNNPGVWLLGAVDKEERGMGLGRTVEYANHRGAPIWVDPDTLIWDYLAFRQCSCTHLHPDRQIPLTFAPTRCHS